MNRYGGLAAILAFVAIAPGVGANAAAQTSRPLAVSCSANSFKIVFDASGQVRILQYYVHWTEAKATGKVLAYMDQSTKQTNGSCRSAKPRRFRPSGFIGPPPTRNV